MTNLSKFQKDINIKFKKKDLLLEALTHKSANEKYNNEKLEFVGDRVIGLVLSKKLFDLYPNEKEGILDKRFASLVNRKICCEVGYSIGIQDFIIVGNKKKKITKKDEKIISDCCEALIAAIYIDQGFAVVKEFILKIWKNKLSKSNVTILDSKTKLQEYSLKLYKKLPHYSYISSSGPKHNPIYKISVSIVGTKKFIGVGGSKQQAEQDGAKQLLKSININ
jgi:ribonuclease III